MSLGNQVTLQPNLEITIYRLCVEDRIVVIASDGIWEVMENQEVLFSLTKVIDKLLPYAHSTKLEKGCDFLMKELLKRWSKESMVDDITFIAILFD